MVHAFTCTGLTETQYHSFSKAAGMGSVMDKTIDTSVWLSPFNFLVKLWTLKLHAVMLLFTLFVLVQETISRFLDLTEYYWID